MNEDQRPRWDEQPSASTYGRDAHAAESGAASPGYQPYPPASAQSGGLAYGGGHDGGYRTPSDSDRSLAAVAHVATLIGTLISAGWLGFVVPLVMWFMYKERSPFVRQAAAGAFNFNIGMWIANAIAWVCMITIILIPVAILIWIGAGILFIVCHILGTLRALKGETFRYPFQLPFLR